MLYFYQSNKYLYFGSHEKQTYTKSNRAIGKSVDQYVWIGGSHACHRLDRGLEFKHTIQQWIIYFRCSLDRSRHPHSSGWYPDPGRLSNILGRVDRRLRSVRPQPALAGQYDAWLQWLRSAHINRYLPGGAGNPASVPVLVMGNPGKIFYLMGLHRN